MAQEGTVFTSVRAIPSLYSATVDAILPCFHHRVPLVATMNFITQPNGRAAMEIYLANSNLSVVVIPDLNNANNGHLIAYWVGLDGIDKGANQIVVQARFDSEKQQDGTVMHRAWCE